MLAHQVGPAGLHHLGPDQQPQGGEDAAQDARHRGLAGAGRAGEHEVPGGRLAGQAVRVPQPGHPQLGRDGADLLLDRLQSDQLVELGDRALDRGRVLIAAQPAGQLGVGLLQVLAADSDQVFPAGFGRAGHHPHVAGLARLLQQAADEPAVAELVGDPAAADFFQRAPQHRPGVRVEQLAAAVQRHLGQRQHLRRGVAGELQPGGEAGGQAGVGGQERLHLLLVAGQDDDQVLAVVLGPLEQGLDRLDAEPVGLAVTLVDQAVGLVDEQHPAQRAVDQLVGLDRGRAQVLADQVGPVRLDHLGHLQQAERVEDLGQHPGHGGLAGAGRAQEDEVPHRLVGGDTGHGPPPGGLDGGRDRADLLLDRGQPDHRVQFGHGVLDRDLRTRPRSGGLVVAGAVLGVGQRGGLGRVGPDAAVASAVAGGAGGAEAPGRLVRRGGRARGAGQRAEPPGLAGPVRAVHPHLLHVLGQPPAEDGQGDQDGGDDADQGLVRPVPEQDETGRQGPQHGPGRGAARHVGTGQPAGAGRPGHGERQDGQRYRPHPEHVEGHPDREHPGGGGVGGGAAGPPLDHGDGGAQQGERQDERPQADGGGGQHDLDQQGGLAEPAHDPGGPGGLVLRGGLGPVVWQHLASLPLVPASRRPQPVAGQSYVLV